MAYSRHIVLTGAAGFIGCRLITKLLCSQQFADCRFTLVDRVALSVPESDRVAHLVGDFSSPDILETLFSQEVSAIVHLAGILGGAAEADYDLARKVNVDGTLRLLERVRGLPGKPSFVFASSIAVFGPDLPKHVDDDTPPQPVMTYGAQKRMLEIALEQFSARGWIDGIALRLPGIVANREADARLKSAYLNSLFYQLATNADITVPVERTGTSWLISVGACIDAFVHALQIPVEALGRQRAFTLPALRVEMGALVDALRRRYPNAGGSVTFAPDPTLSKQFAAHPTLSTAAADALGFVHDGTIDRLVERSYE